MPEAQIKETYEYDEKELVGLSLDPRAVLPLLWAIFLDILGVINFFLSFLAIGIVTSFIVDALAILTLGWWGWKRSGQVARTKGSTKALNKFLKRFVSASAVELIPFLGDIVTSWTLYVFMELRDADKK